MRNWKTTLAGLLAAAPIAIDALITAYNAGAFTGKSGGQLLIAIGLILLSTFAKDHNVSGQKLVDADADIGLPVPKKK
jgi:hypothetical protein